MFRWSSSPRVGFAASIPRRRKWNRGCAWRCSISIVSFTAFFALLLVLRQTQLRREPAQSLGLEGFVMLTFAIAYLAVWLGVLAYVLRLGAKQRRLLRTLESLQSTGDPSR